MALDPGKGYRPKKAKKRGASNPSGPKKTSTARPVGGAKKSKGTLSSDIFHFHFGPLAPWENPASKTKAKKKKRTILPFENKRRG